MSGTTLRAPDELEPRVGWRVWNVVEAGGALQLGSLVYHTLWCPGAEIEGRCRRPLALLPWARLPLHATPSFDCCCGIYAVARPELAVPYLSSRLEQAAPSVHRVIGRVRLWGRVVEATWGWRATFGYPEHLYVPRRSRLGDLAPFRPSAASIARHLDGYRVPVEVIGDVEGRGMEALFPRR